MDNQTALSHTHVHLLTSALDNSTEQVSSSLQESLQSQSQVLTGLSEQLKDQAAFLQDKVADGLEGVSTKLQQVGGWRGSSGCLLACSVRGVEVCWPVALEPVASCHKPSDGRLRRSVHRAAAGRWVEGQCGAQAPQR